MSHVHEVTHTPPSGDGYQVCECGATRRVARGKPEDAWHTCKLCTHSWGLEKKKGVKQ